MLQLSEMEDHSPNGVARSKSLTTATMPRSAEEVCYLLGYAVCEDDHQRRIAEQSLSVAESHVEFSMLLLQERGPCKPSASLGLSRPLLHLSLFAHRPTHSQIASCCTRTILVDSAIDARARWLAAVYLKNAIGRQWLSSSRR